MNRGSTQGAALALAMGVLGGWAACAPAAPAAAVQAPVPAAAPRAVSPDSLLAPSRIAALPEAERAAWTAYLEASRRHAAADRAVIDAELRALGRETWTPAPAGRGFFVTDEMTEAWFRGAEARRTADAIVSFQTPSGGWSKRLDFTRPRQPGESFSAEQRWTWVGTLDNGATAEQMRFLAGILRAHDEPAYRAAFLRGMEYLLAAQQPTGCWPQAYPLMGGYHDAATFNDDAGVNALRVLRGAARGEHAWVPEEVRARAAASVERGVGCILATQIEVGGRKTAWGAQHDPITFAPVQARAYEHASLSGRESAAILNFLMEIEAPPPAVREAVNAAAAWFRETAVTGQRYVPRGDLTPDPAAEPIWARFYEIGTNRPIFSDRDGVVRYALSEIGDERRTGYLWYTDEPATSLRRYERWVRRNGGTARE
jgi:PelA/Pel-15E family pectate lyase